MRLFAVFAFLAALLLYALQSQQMAHAQQAALPRDQALTQKLIVEINSGLACNTSLIDAQQQIAKLQAELKDKDAPAAKTQDKLPMHQNTKP